MTASYEPPAIEQRVPISDPVLAGVCGSPVSPTWTSKTGDEAGDS